MEDDKEFHDPQYNGWGLWGIAMYIGFVAFLIWALML